MTSLRTPDFPRSLKVGFEETELVSARFAARGTDSMVMLDVGAHRGTSTIPFAEQGWRVYAFEPDPTNRAAFVRSLYGFDNVTVDPRAVSNADGDEVTLYASKESSGISSLHAFTDGHDPVTTVGTVRLDTFIGEHGIRDVDFLKMDTEGFDLMVLRGFPWRQIRPAVVLCEFEDNKTESLGYTTGDMIEFLLALDYTLLVSEWHPIERYGVTHSFRHLRRYEGITPPQSSWGNVIAVTNARDVDMMLELAPGYFERRNDFRDAPLQSMRFDAWRRFPLRSSRIIS